MHCPVLNCRGLYCTGLAQALGVSVNKPLKGILRNALDELMEAMNQAELDTLDGATDSAIGRRMVLMTRAVAEAWEQVGGFSSSPRPTSLLRLIALVLSRYRLGYSQSFRQLGMPLPLDGSAMELNVKGLDGLELGDWQRTIGRETPLEEQN